MLETLDLGGRGRNYFTANNIEDAALILMSQVRRDGYLNVDITADMALADGRRVAYRWEQPVEEPLPRELQARAVHFKISEGVLFYLKRLDFEGLASVRESRARSFFIETDALLRTRSSRIYTPQRLEQGLSSLTDELRRLGHEEALVTVRELDRDDASGAVTAIIEVVEGRKWMVRSMRQEIFYDTDDEPGEVKTVQPREPYSRFWQQDFIQALRREFYQRGYPDVKVELQPLKREPGVEIGEIDLLATVRTGPEVRVGKVVFDGEEKTRRSVMKRRVPLGSGDLLDRIKAERGRSRLSRLGIFDSVELDYEPVDEHTRDVVYAVEEGRRIDVSLLFGYGSYELLRGGVEVDQHNLFGRAHHARFRAVQSFKASTANYTYTMPELLGEDFDVFFNAFGLRREEVSFTREEYGGGAGVRRFFRPLASDVSLRYTYQVLNAADTTVALPEAGVRNPGVGAVILDLSHDRRDNPLYPRSGYKVYSSFEVASEYLAGDVNYERLELGASYHQPLGAGRWLHLGLSHGDVFTVGSMAEDLPFNKRFFPGGENSIRGYPEGEASPRNALGQFIGAETFSLLSVEFEQALTRSWSVVLFSDGLFFARELRDFPFDEKLFSVGGGIRWKTLVGPVRLEYGHNLNPRDGDPGGTLHFSVGFPF